MPHRRSFWKTIVLAAASALFFAATALLAFYFLRSPFGAIAMAVLLVPAVTALAVVIGGLLCLHRDSRQQAGRADLFYLLTRPSPRRDRLRRYYRFLLGPQLHPGDFVRVRSEEEIRRTLDAAGALDSLPFMPEMLRYCGRKFVVDQRVDKINDMITKTGLRRFYRTVTLRELRCDGGGHGGCQAECQILWKEAWLERVGHESGSETSRQNENPAPKLAALLQVNTIAPPPADPASADAVVRYRCQATELLKASHAMARADLRQDLRALRHGNVGWRAFIVVALTRLFNRVQWLRGGVRYPWRPPGSSVETPRVDLGLQAGDRVRIKDGAAIARTLDADNRNRGMWFDPEMLRYCGQEFRVRRRVERLIDERNGRMLKVKTPNIMLEGVTATGEFLRFNPQNEYIFWREVWLEPVERRDAPSV